MCVCLSLSLYIHTYISQCGCAYIQSLLIIGRRAFFLCISPLLKYSGLPHVCMCGGRWWGRGAAITTTTPSTRYHHHPNPNQTHDARADQRGKPRSRGASLADFCLSLLSSAFSLSVCGLECDLGPPSPPPQHDPGQRLLRSAPVSTTNHGPLKNALVSHDLRPPHSFTPNLMPCLMSCVGRPWAAAIPRGGPLCVRGDTADARRPQASDTTKGLTPQPGPLPLLAPSPPHPHPHLRGQHCIDVLS